MIIRRSHFIPVLGIVTLLLLSHQANAAGQDLRRPATTTTFAVPAEPGGTQTFSPTTQAINQRDTGNRLRSSASIASSPTITSTFAISVGPDINPFSFVPATQTINQGDAINWVWDYTSTFTQHSTTSGTCSGLTCTADHIWDSTIQGKGFNFSHTFNTFGTFPYFCSVHQSAMQGTIVVTPPFKLFLPLILK